MKHEVPITEFQACPAQDVLRRFGNGLSSDEEFDRIVPHLEACQQCQATLDRFDEDSDTVVRALATLPANASDEVGFQELHEQLISRPEPFGTTIGFQRRAIVHHEFALPHRLGGYELIELIGRGANGSVYRAKHVKLDRVVAIKILSSALEDDAAVQDFFREMKAVGKLNHPHIISATDAGEADGHHYLAMEFVDGIDVSTLLARTEKLSVANACEIVRQAALGLEYAHQNGMVHRDVKPSNLQFSFDGQVKLLDLGLVSFSSGNKNTTAGEIARGTADYMSPEQWFKFEQVDLKADLYSLGCTLFKLLTGNPPYRPLPQGVVSKQTAHASHPVPSVKSQRSDVPASVDKIIQRLTAKNPADRPTSAAAVARALAPFSRRSNLRIIGKEISGDVLGAQREANRLRRTRISRRALMVTAAASVPAFGFFFIRPSNKAKLSTESWRSLMPTPSSTYLSSGSGNFSFNDKTKNIQLRSEGFGLAILGQPVKGIFTLRASISNLTTNGSFGIALGYHRNSRGGINYHRFRTVQISSENDKPLMSWTDVTLERARTQQTNVHLNLASEKTLGDCPIDTDQHGESFDLSICVGQSSFPEIRLMGREYPEPKWEFAFEGKHRKSINKRNVRAAYLGRVGIFVQEGSADFRNVEFRYEPKT